MPLVILPHNIQASSKTVATLFMPFGSLPHIIQASSGESRHVIHATPRDRCCTVQVLPIVRSYDV